MRKRRVINRTETDIILRKHNIKITGKYEINDLGKIDVEGDVNFKYSNLNRLPLRFGRVNGFFNCSGLGLKSLKGAPESVEYYFACNNNDLTSLKYGPKYVGGTYDCSHNELKNLIGCATEIGRDLVCKMNKLKTLNGSPKELRGRLNVSHNLINNLEGSPQKIWGEIYATSTFLNNLNGLSTDFEGTLFLDASAKSINTGLLDYKNMRIELRLINKFGYNFMPTQIMDNYQYIDIILKYQRYYEIWTEQDGQDELDEDNFQMFIEDIKDGLL